jgi:CubicO group peptidase (beta-lactamase class C family)
MKYSKYLTLLIVAALAISNQATAQPADLSSHANQVHTLLEKQMHDRDIPGLQIAVIQKGKLVFTDALGVSELANNTPVAMDTIFSINSITKAFTGVAVMQLVEAGKLDLTKPVGSYLEGLPVPWQSVRVEQLLAHTSGIPDILDKRSEKWLVEDIGPKNWEEIKALPMEFKTGDKFSYNATNYVLIGMIINKLSGQDFSEFITKQQLELVGMPKTGYSDFYDVVPKRALPYSNMHYINGEWWKYKKLGNVSETFPDFIRTASGMHSTVGDLSNWILALQNGKLLKNKTSIEQLWRPVHLNDGKTAGFSDLLNGYAIGWPVVIRKNHPAYAAVGGGRAALVIYPEDDLTVIVLSNRLGASPESWVDDIAKFYFQ